MSTDVTQCPLTKGEHMLVAVDGSEHSDFAVDQAISLGGMCNSKIFLLSVVSLLPEYVGVAPDYVDNLTEQAQKYLADAKQKVEQANIACETILRKGANPSEYILDEAEKKQIDLIVMGTHGRSGLEKLFLGSVAQKVVGHAPCPVMVIPARE